jgi:non-specific serine/threonine protein kinase/serine/threonine-protein kinase
MTPERYQQIKQVFQRAIELAPSERKGYLDTACGADAEIRAEVESLLELHETGQHVLDRPLADVAPDFDDAPSNFVGRRIGSYRLERLLGEGGMGAVYEATRVDDQFQQRVALKLVKGGMYSEDVLRRFRQERQILAGLVHPHIARLLDGGVTPDGQPYFVMEFIDGKPVDKYCSEKRLGIRERLELFRDVCGAVQYAHQNLIVHRDLKPGNILVTSGGDVKLLDFGIAKLLREAGEDAVTQTGTGMHAMTPEYASPEQVRGDSVTTAADVYSLGVVLYELLTGIRPFQLKERVLAEMARIICEEEPTKPSTAVTGTGGKSTIGDVKPDRLRRDLAGDLDNIVLLALRKEPNRRYSSSEAFSEDVRRYLAGEPVTAHPPSFTYRSAKFVRRHVMAVTAAGLVMAAVAAGTAATAWQARIASRERARAVKRFTDVRELAHSFLFDFNDSLQGVPGATAARRLIVGKGLQYLDTLASESGNDVPLIRELGSAYLRVGDLQGNPGVANIGDSQGALASYRKALAILEPLSVKGDYDSRAEFALALTRFGDLLWAMGDSPQALIQYQRALALQEELASQRPADLVQRSRSGYNCNNIGDLYLESNDLDRAEASYAKGLTISKSVAAATPKDSKARLDLALSHMKLGDVAWYRGDWQKALVLYREGTALRESLLAEYPQNSIVRHFLVSSHDSIGDTLAKQGDIDAAVAQYRKSLEIADASASADRANQQAQRDLMVCLVNLSELLEKQGNLREAAEKARLQLSIADNIAKQGTPSRLALEDQANARERVGNIAMRMGSLQEAWKLHSASSEIRERILATEPTAEARRNLCGSYLALERLARQLSSRANSAEDRALWKSRADVAMAHARKVAGEISRQSTITAIDREILDQLRKDSTAQ